MSQAGRYNKEKYVAEILETAKKTGKDSYNLPKLKMQIKLNEGVRLIHWIEDYVSCLFGNKINSRRVRRNKTTAS